MTPLKIVLKYLFGVFFVLAGLNHFYHPTFYDAMIPPMLPWPRGLVIVSGIAEVVLGVALLIPSLQRPAAWGLILLLIAVFPANLSMATHPERFGSIPPAMLWARLPLQAVLIAWAYWFT